jgi:hypothetical membrane protein
MHLVSDRKMYKPDQVTEAALPAPHIFQRWVLLSIAALAGMAYASFPLAIWLNAPFAMHGEVSILGEAGQPHAALFNSLDIVSGCLLTALSIFLLILHKGTSKSWRWALVALLVSGLGAISAAILPLPAVFSFPNSLHALLHISAAVFAHGFASFINTSAFIMSTILWMFIILRGGLPRKNRLALAGSMLLIVAVGPILTFIFPKTGDITQRVFIVLFAIWLVFFTHDALQANSHPEL